MRAGSLDRRVTIRRQSQNRNEYNELENVWNDVRTVAASRTDLSATERFVAGQLYAVRAVTFRTRYMADLLPTDRLVCEGVTYEVKGIRELGRREGLEIAAEAS